MRANAYIIFFCDLGVTGLSVVFANDTKRESQLTTLRRSVVSVKADEKCYRKFFVGNMPPTGFKSSTGKAKNIRYICQQPSKYRTPFFAAMFDLNYGIPIYAAYVVKQQQANKFGSASRGGQKFRQEPGERQRVINITLTYLQKSR